MSTRLSTREQLLNRRRAEEAKVDELLKFNAAMTGMKSANEREARLGGRIRANTYAQRASEQMFRKLEEEDARTRKVRGRATAQDTALAEELALRKAADESRRLEVQRICDADPGLRELQEKLKTAYVTAERHRQLKEADEMKVMDEELRRTLEAQEEHDRMMGLREEAAREERRRLSQLEGRRVIEDQIIDKERRKFYEGQEQARRDKEAIDDVIGKLAAEEAAEKAAIARKKAETQAFIRNFQEEHARWKEDQRRAEREEEERIMAYARAKEAREAGVAAKKAAEDAEKERMYRQIVERQEALAAQLEEEENLRMLLAEEETEAKIAAQAAARDAKRRADVAEMMAANEAQKRLKAELLEKQRREEDEFIAMLRRKYEADDAADRAEKERRAAANSQYKEEVERQKAERAAMFEMQRQAELRSEKVSAEREAFRQRVVAEARRKLLEEHAAKLRDFLPKGVIMDEDDLKIIMRYDTNKDGRVDDTELAQLKRDLVKAGDADGDGRLTGAEKAVAWERVMGDDAGGRGGAGGF
mmetsp:Transcript_83711/g.203060  ORF Transcript_83711/g.203060 Transcript_83711/m.203060 type:complete len:534 (+) Transcript_83711:392-1993(+)